MLERVLIKVDADLVDLIPNYLKNLHANLEEIKEHFYNGDLSACQRLGHNLKGSGGSYGFDFISEMGAAIEADAKSGRGLNVIQHVSSLGDYLNRLDIKYEEVIAS